MNEALEDIKAGQTKTVLYMFGLALGAAGYLVEGFSQELYAIGSLILLLSIVMTIADELKLSQLLRAGIISVGAVSSICSCSFVPFMLSCAIAGGDTLRVYSLMRTYHLLSTTVVILAILGCIVGLLSWTCVDNSGIEYLSLGFANPNGLSALLTVFLLTMFLIGRKKMFAPQAIAAVAVIVFEVVVLASRSAAAVSVLGLIGFSFVRAGKTKWLWYMFIVPLAVAVLFSLSFMAYDPSLLFASNINDLFSGRLNIAHDYYTQFGATLLGQDITTTTKYGILIDCSYAQLMTKYGMMFMVMMVGLQASSCVMAVRRGHPELALLIALLSVYGTMESYVLTLAMNFTMPMVGSLCLEAAKSAHFNSLVYHCTQAGIMSVMTIRMDIYRKPFRPSIPLTMRTVKTESFKAKSLLTMSQRAIGPPAVSQKMFTARCSI